MVTERACGSKHFVEKQPSCQHEKNNNNNSNSNNGEHRTRKENRFEMIRRRYFSDPLTANNPLSKMKKNLTFHRKKPSHETNHNTEPLSPTVTCTQTSSTVDVNAKKRHTIAFDFAPQVKESSNEMKSKDARMTRLSFADNFCDVDYDDNVALFADENQTSYGKLNTINKAADFVRRRANFLRKTHIKSLKNKQQQQNRHSFNDKSSPTDTTRFTTVNNNELNSQVTEDDKRISGGKNANARPKRFIWKNARKRVRYVVRLIRRESKLGSDADYFEDTDDEDEVMLIEESNEGELLAPYSSPYRLRSRSLTNMATQNENKSLHESIAVSFTALNIKYLSPKGRKLDRFADLTPRSSMRSSTKDSVESDINTSHSFLSKKYLDKSKSLDSMKVTTSENNVEEGSQHDFEQHYLGGVNDIGNHDNRDVADLNCIQNNLYNTTGDDGDEDDSNGNNRHNQRELFEVLDEEMDDIIADEVNSYMSVDQEHQNLKKQRRTSDIFHFNDNLDADSTVGDFSNIKHTSALSYSVNDLYDLFNKDRFMNFETSFDDLVV